MGRGAKDRPSAPSRRALLRDRSGVIPSSGDDDAPSTDQALVVAPQSVRTAQRPTLMMMAGDAPGRVFRIEGDRITIGRSKRANVELQENGISRIHCALMREESGWFLQDLGSTNGTLVNGARATRAELSAGDRIQLGPEVVFQFGFFDDAEEGLATKLYEAATRDPLTRVHNRRFLMERLNAEISFATRHEQQLIVVLFDVDHFKTINDQHGHVSGDVVLRDVAYALGQSLRNEDVLARYGGEEFVVLARGLALKNGAQLAERIRKSIASRAVVTPMGRVAVTVSAGVAALAECDPKTGAKLLSLADARLYAAKQAGRNRVVAR